MRVGLLEAEAQEQGYNIEVNWADAGGWYSQKRIGETHAAAKFIYEAGRDRIWVRCSDWRYGALSELSYLRAPESYL